MSTEPSQFAICMRQLKDQISALSSSRNLNESTILIPELNSSLQISNQHIKHQLQHGAAFKDLLDPRDQILEHQFNFKEMFSQKDMSEDIPFVESKLYQNILGRIKIFLVETVSNVVSIAFKFMCKGELQEKQAKEYASKNIMLNLHSIFRQTILAIEKNISLQKYVKREELREKLVVQLENQLNNILINLADCYPQAPAAGGTPRMRQVITEVNRQDDEQNDFFFTSGLIDRIHFEKFLQFRIEKNELGQEIKRLDLGKQGDYVEFIMETINSAIGVTNQSREDEKGRTVFEVFNQFNEQFFWINQQKQYQQFLNTLDKKYQFDVDQNKKDQKKKGDHICHLFQNIFQENNCFKNKKEEEVPELNELWLSSEDGIERMKQKKNFALGQKIPASVKSFSREEIKNKEFTAKHSSILRILTKWAQNLEQIFQNPEKSVKKRLYPFTTQSGVICQLLNNHQEGDIKLCIQLEDEYRQVREKFNAILRDSYGFMGRLLSSPKQSVISSIYRYTETRTISSKINAVLTSLMLSYTNMLIHHLLKAGQNILTEKGYQDINLLVFRVSDLMRSKLQCNQSTFISVLKTMYLLDSRSFMDNRFRIVKIRNKLDDPSNNVMINYLFMGKVECQLQLSIQEPKGKEKNYYTFSHFVYELTRGKFGAIAECAIMISQLDPMINVCKSGYYEQKQEKVNLIRQKQLRESKGGLFDTIMKQITELSKVKNHSSFYECFVCNKLVTIDNFGKILEKADEKICYQCFLHQRYPEQLLKSDTKNSLRKIYRHRLKHYRYLRALRDDKYLVTLTPSGEIQFSMIAFLPKQLKVLQLKLNSQVLEQYSEERLNFGELEYSDITSDIKKSMKKPTPLKKLSYLFDKIDAIPDEILDRLNLKKDEIVKKGRRLLMQLREYIKQENIIKTIKYKAEIIKANEQDGQVLDKVCRVLVLGQGKKAVSKVLQTLMLGIQEKDELALRYNKELSLDLSNMTNIESENVIFEEMPKWIVQCTCLKKLTLDHNNIKVISNTSLPSSLIELSLKGNKLNCVDVQGLLNLHHLHIQKNPLNSLNLGEKSVLQSLSIHSTQLQNIKFLPQILQVLWANRKTVINFNFELLCHLKYLKVRHGLTTRKQLTNLDPEVKLESRK